MIRSFTELISKKQISHNSKVSSERYYTVKFSVHYFYAKKNIYFNIDMSVRLRIELKD